VASPPHKFSSRKNSLWRPHRAIVTNFYEDAIEFFGVEIIVLIFVELTALNDLDTLRLEFFNFLLGQCIVFWVDIRIEEEKKDLLIGKMEGQNLKPPITQEAVSRD